MKIALVTPAAPQSRSGNRNTTTRWAAMLRELGHRVDIVTQWNGKPADAMLALHARRSYGSIKRFARHHPDRPLIVTLTGTDLYHDIRVDADAQESLCLATRLIVLQDMGLHELSPAMAEKARVVYQSAQPIEPQAPLKNGFEVCVIGHLREVKDPLRAAYALKHLPVTSKICIKQMGSALESEMGRAAQAMMAEEPRYHWLGELAHWKVRKYLARSRVMVISSRMEGGANVVSEALMADVPVIASYVSGNIGMLGEDYPGYFPYGDERALAELLSLVETDSAFLRLLQRHGRERKKRISALQEKRSLAAILREIQSDEVS